MDFWKCDFDVRFYFAAVLEIRVGDSVDDLVLLYEDLLFLDDLIAVGYLLFEVADHLLFLLGLVLQLPLVVLYLLLLYANLLLLYDSEQVRLVRGTQLAGLNLNYQVAQLLLLTFDLSLQLLFLLAVCLDQFLRVVDLFH